MTPLHSSTAPPLSPGARRELRRLVGTGAVVDDPSGLHTYECDGYTLEKVRPALVLLPQTVEQVQQIVRYCHAQAIPFVARGAGTGVSGGCLPAGIPVMIGTSRLRKIRRIDYGNGWVEAEAGVVNLDVTRAVAARGCFYAPDPSSQAACTIGGNVAENSGGPHTLKYGVTVNHLLGLELVLPNGELLRIDRSAAPGGYDLIGILAGSEGTLGIVTAATLRIVPRPQALATLLAVFPDVVSACRGVSAIISSGVLPAALELMDSLIAAAVESIFRIGLPKDAGAVLLIELDGLACGLEAACARVERACRLEGASEIRRARDEQERETLWKCRKRAFGAMGRLAPSYCTQDGVVPRSRLPEIAERIAVIASRHRLRIANLMHAGDGNIHPILLYDERDEDEVQRVLHAGEEILDACLDLGGSITGEHGIGVEKLALMFRAFTPDTIAAMNGVREVFNPSGLCNPGKVLPSDRGCIEIRRPRPRAGG